ncbi:MAG: GntR family transcriptional regulator [Bacillota bacterium]|nr:GntR family transcriptional regulator [Bacillota bacterium]
MKVSFDNEKSIYIQIAEAIKDDILKDIFEEETQIPSTTQMSVSYRINPATAAKGVNMLVDEGIIYKKRGIGMFVASGAKEDIRNSRKNEFFDKYIAAMIEEAQKLGISREDIIDMIKGGEKKHG